MDRLRQPRGTVAFGGTIADALPTVWPDLDRWRWTG
jgi:hypothetical protein